MKFTILTLFPDIFNHFLDFSILKRAKEKNAIELNIVDIRSFTTDKHKTVDDHPYGGGVGMILKVDVIDRALSSLKLPARIASQSDAGGQSTNYNLKPKIVLLDPRGKQFNQKTAKKYSKLDHLILICGHYEGVDERVKSLVDETISIGDFIVTGGEIPSLLITEATTRLLPNVLIKKEATRDETFKEINHENQKIQVLSYPQYTRPSIYKNMRVPKILLSGNHEKILVWREKKSLQETKKLRPDLLK